MGVEFRKKVGQRKDNQVCPGEGLNRSLWNVIRWRAVDRLGIDSFDFGLHPRVLHFDIAKSRPAVRT